MWPEYNKWKKDTNTSLRPKRKVNESNPYARTDNLTDRQKKLKGIKPGERVRPMYVPKIDKGGVKLWDGFRASLGFTGEVKEEMERTRAAGCKYCGGEAESIDHVEPISKLQTELTRYLVCDGKFHFTACLKTEAMDLYNEGPFVWSCKSCNSSKGGQKGLDANPPQFAERCPGGDKCQVPAGGKAVY